MSLIHFIWDISEDYLMIRQNHADNIDSEYDITIVDREAKSSPLSYVLRFFQIVKEWIMHHEAGVNLLWGQTSFVDAISNKKSDTIYNKIECVGRVENINGNVRVRIADQIVLSIYDPKKLYFGFSLGDRVYIKGSIARMNRQIYIIPSVVRKK